MITEKLKDLILKMLDKNPETRITLPQVKVRIRLNFLFVTLYVLDALLFAQGPAIPFIIYDSFASPFEIPFHIVLTFQSSMKITPHSYISV